MAAVSGDGRAPIDAEPLLGPDIDGWLRGRITYNRAVAGVHYKQIDKSVWIFRYVYDEDSIFVLKDAKCIRKARAQNLGENGVP